MFASLRLGITNRRTQEFGDSSGSVKLTGSNSKLEDTYLPLGMQDHHKLCLGLSRTEIGAFATCPIFDWIFRLVPNTKSYRRDASSPTHSS